MIWINVVDARGSNNFRSNHFQILTQFHKKVTSKTIVWFLYQSYSYIQLPIFQSRHFVWGQNNFVLYESICDTGVKIASCCCCLQIILYYSCIFLWCQKVFGLKEFAGVMYLIFYLKYRVHNSARIYENCSNFLQVLACTLQKKSHFLTWRNRFYGFLQIWLTFGGN